MAIAKTAGSSPRSTRSVHQATASLRSARGSTLANFHSLRARNLLNHWARSSALGRPPHPFARSVGTMFCAGYSIKNFARLSEL